MLEGTCIQPAGQQLKTCAPPAMQCSDALVEGNLV